MAEKHKERGGDPFRWAHTIEWRGEEYFFYVGNIYNKQRADEIVSDLVSKGYDTKIVRPWSGFGIVYLIYTKPKYEEEAPT